MRNGIAGILVAILYFLGVARSEEVFETRDTDTRIVFNGRIVMYDWMLHGTSNNDDFVVKVASSSKELPVYLRIVHNPAVWDAPPAPRKQLDRLAFIGRGVLLTFTVRRPSHVSERNLCASIAPDFTFEDDEGTGTIPRYIATPGANVNNIPRISRLHCYILIPSGLESAPDSGARIFPKKPAP